MKTRMFLTRRPAFQAAVLVAAVLFGGLSFTTAGQNSQKPSFQVTARLVELTVVAVDADGNPVTDLTQEDFTLLDEGKPRELALCRFEGGTAQESAKKPALPPYIYTNRLETGASEERNVTALVLDFANTEPGDQMFVKAQTSKLLESLAPKTRVAIYVMGANLRVVHDFTDDMDALRANLARLHTEVQVQSKSDVERAAQDFDALLDEIESRPPSMCALTAVFESAAPQGEAAVWAEVNNNAFVTGNRVEGTLTMLEALGRHLADVPGRKNVVWISSGISLFAQQTSTTPFESVNSMSGDNQERAIRRTSRRMAECGVALYGVDARGLTTTNQSFAKRQYPPALPGRFSEVQRAENFNIDSRAAFSLMTSVTGGRFIFGTNDLSEGVKKVTADLEGSYSLGFYPTEKPDGKWHTLKVKVRRPDIRLLYKEGYRFDSAPAKQPAWTEADKIRAMTTPFGSDSIRLNARCAPAGTEAGALQLDLQIEAEDLLWREESGRSAASLDVYIGEKTSEGEIKFQQSKINARLLPPQMEVARSRGIPYHHVWRPDAGTVNLRVLVRDTGTGRTGTIDIPLPVTVAKK